MTTDFDVSFFTEIFGDPNWPLFRTSTTSSCTKLRSIGLIELVTHLSPRYPSLSLASAHIGRIAAEALTGLASEGYRNWVYVDHGVWQPATKMVRHRRLWPTIGLLEIPGVSRISNEVVFEANDCLRFAGMVEVTGDAFLEAIQLVRTRRSSFLMCTNRPHISSDTGISKIFRDAFPQMNLRAQESVDWPSLVIGFCPQGDVVVRVTGEFDDRAAGIDIIGETQILKRISGLFEKSKVSLPKTRSEKLGKLAERSDETA